jgi:rhamnulokinase
VLLLPDLVAYWLTGVMRAEPTNASTTGLLDARRGEWSTDLLARLDIPAHLMPPLQQPGEVRGTVREELGARLGLPASVVVTTVGSHDTASAVVAVPATDRRFAYVSSGTWSLVGLELEQPVISAASRAANFTNERGVDGRTRFLRNTGGLWLLQESMRAWADDGEPQELGALLAAAADRPLGGPVFDVDDAALIPPGDMPARIATAIESRGGRPPATPSAITRCIIDSLAEAFASAIQRAGELAAVDVEVVHVVGGGAQNTLLCQLTADRTGRPVTAGPVEATALGNVLVQARAAGAVPDSLEDIRAGLSSAVEIRRYEPAG